MASRRRVIYTLAGVIGLLFLTALAVYLAVIGLDKADKVASVIGAFVGLIGVGFAVLELVRCRAVPTPCQPLPIDKVLFTRHQRRFTRFTRPACP